MDKDAERAADLTQRLLDGTMVAAEEDDLEGLMQLKVGLEAANKALAEARRRSHEPQAQVLLGLAALHGWGVLANDDEARRAFHRAHEQGCRQGTCWKASMLLLQSDDCGVTEALRLLHEAASGWRSWRSDRDAAARLLFMLAVWDQDARWYRRSAALGYTMAQWEAEALYEGEEQLLVPYGEWEPRYHPWCTVQIKQEMMQALLVCKRAGIPRALAEKHLLSLICTQPRPEAEIV